MEEINAKIFGVNIDHPFFNHLLDEEKETIKADIERGFSHTVYIFGGGHEMGAVINIEADAIHIQECGGNFIELRHALENYCTKLAKFSGKKKISLCSVKTGIGETAIRKHNFHRANGNQFEKEIAHGR